MNWKSGRNFPMLLEAARFPHLLGTFCGSTPTRFATGGFFRSPGVSTRSLVAGELMLPPGTTDVRKGGRGFVGEALLNSGRLGGSTDFLVESEAFAEETTAPAGDTPPPPGERNGFWASPTGSKGVGFDICSVMGRSSKIPRLKVRLVQVHAGKGQERNNKGVRRHIHWHCTTARLVIHPSCQMKLPVFCSPYLSLQTRASVPQQALEKSLQQKMIASPRRRGRRISQAPRYHVRSHKNG